MELKVNTREVRKRRLLQGLTITDLASNAGINSKYLSAIEQGQRSPGPRTIKRIADALGVEVADIAEVVGLDGSESNDTTPRQVAG